MIFLTNEQREKIRLIDKLFSSLDVEELRKITEAEQIVSKLKGSELATGIIEKLCEDNLRMDTDLIRSTADIYALKNDFQILLKAVSSLTTNSEFTALKSRYGVY